MNKKCIYGAIRNNYLKSTELLNNLIPDENWGFNNILSFVNSPPSILGCFQLYFKKDIYNLTNLINAALGDYSFGYNNFNLFCNLENIVYLHIGPSQKNWDGKLIDFDDDCNIKLENIYFNCNIKCHNKYYNRKKTDVTFIINEINNIDIKNDRRMDITTCSSEFRYKNFLDKIINSKNCYIKVIRLNIYPIYLIKYMQ